MTRLKDMRTKRALLQQDVADHLGVARVTYTKYENGTREPDIDTMNRLAAFYGVTIDYLFGNSNDPSEAIDINDLSFAFFDGMPSDLTEEEKHAVIAFAKYTRAIREQEKKE